MLGEGGLGPADLTGCSAEAAGVGNGAEKEKPFRITGGECLVELL